MVTLANQADFISFRHHTFEQPRGAASVQLTECGPRFELKLYQVRARQCTLPRPWLGSVTSRLCAMRTGNQSEVAVCFAGSFEERGRMVQVRLGTLEQAHAENEWTLRAYTRSAKKFKLSEEAGD